MEKHSLIATISPDNTYITLKFSGDLVKQMVEGFREDILVASKVITNKFKADEKKVRTLVDMTEFTGNYSLDALTALVEFAKNNKLFIEKTVAFGGSDKVKIAGEVAITLSGRDNIKLFDSKDEAVAWLLG